MQMNASTVCAASGLEMSWHKVNWAECHRQVRRLQTRIVKATQEGRWNKVKALQWLLTHSWSGRMVAVKRVTENQGKKTPGVDGETWSTPTTKLQAVMSLRRRGYQPLPLRRVFIPKSNGKSRPLGIPTMKDRAMQALYLLALEPVAETLADHNSFGFRPERSTADAREHCFTTMARANQPQWVLEGDIKGCFDNISHSWMLENIPMDKTVLQKWLKAGYVYKEKLFPTNAGTPQGGIISPVLANMTLDGLEALLRNKWGTNKKGNPERNIAAMHQVHLIRYADDFIITGKTKELLEDEVKPIVDTFLKERGLTLSEEKTRVTHIGKGFDFLGWNFRKYDGKLLIKPSKKNVKAFLKNIRETVKKNATAKTENLIKLLNPKIQGWVNYHKGTVATEIFSKVDHEVWDATWQWAKRRHSHKGTRWIKDKYFSPEKNRRWIFSAKTQTKEGNPLTVKLVQANDTNIQRHVKIKGEANPYDPQQETYFESRLGWKMKVRMTGKIQWLRLWWKQDKECPICNQKITEETGWHVHHIIPKSEGGKDNNSNLVLVHPNCHRQIHSQRLEVTKPAPMKGSLDEA
jgi:RNA-directed DNA polymerase